LFISSQLKAAEGSLEQLLILTPKLSLHQNILCRMKISSLHFLVFSVMNGKTIVSQGFEYCYDWSGVMKMILEATEDYDYTADVEEKITTN
jgi:hypothetical protein